MKEFETQYPPDRSTHLQYLVDKGWVSERAVGLLDDLARKYGCIARDLGMFPYEGMDTIMLTWNVPITDLREGGRKRNSHIAQLILSPTEVMFQSGAAGEPRITMVWSDEHMDNIIEQYRTYRS